MVDWQITAKTIYCEAVDDEVTLLVYQDGSAQCTGRKKYRQPNKMTLDLIKGKSKRLKRQVKCSGAPCPKPTEYKEKLLAEEDVTSRPAQG